MNGRGLVAEGPIPPGIDGYQLGKKGINPYVFDWVDGHPMRKSIQEARTLLKEAGYPNGFDKRTNQPLILNYDVPASSSPDDKARLNWYRKQFRKLGISLNIRATQYNRFQEKMRNGNAQIFSWGWHADYPSSRNFLFLLNGDNGKVKYGGENAANYNSDAFNQLFQRYQQLHPGQEREALIEQMIQVAQRDAPWIWGVFPKSFLLTQQWSGPIKVSTIGNNTLKYQSLDPLTRVALQEQWNQPKLWPGFFLVLLLAFFLLPVLISYYQKEKKPIRRL
jgi:ABC-type transport system substrate-binding protein